MKWACSVFFAVAVLAVAHGAHATTIIALPEVELTRASDAIVVGTVIQTNTVVHPGGVVATQAHVQVHQSLRGPVAHSVMIVEVPGGRLPDGLVAHAAGAPQLVGGDMIFGFLERAGKVFRPLGLSYGLLRVRQTKDGSLRVFRESDGLSMVDATGTAVDHHTTVLSDVPLTDFVARILRHMAGPDASVPGLGTVTP